MSSTPQGSRARRVHSDERGLIVSWLVKLAIGLVVVSVVLFDAGSIAVNYFGLDSTANSMAVSLSTSVATGTVDQAALEAQAQDLAKEAGAKLVSVEVTPDHIVHVRIKRRANTLIVGKIGPIKKWAKAVADGQAGTT